jgi:hypothetical protein
VGEDDSPVSTALDVHVVAKEGGQKGRPTTVRKVAERYHQLCLAPISRGKRWPALSVACRLDDNLYPKGVAVTDQEIDAINLTCDDFHSDWNYTSHRRSIPDAVATMMR